MVGVDDGIGLGGVLSEIGSNTFEAALCDKNSLLSLRRIIGSPVRASESVLLTLKSHQWSHHVSVMSDQQEPELPLD